jgi:Radical SAM superfamily
MRVGFVFAYMDNRHRLGRKYDGPVQPMTGTLIAALLPGVDVEVVHDNSPDEIDWNRSYDLLFISSIHSDFDRARQISHYFRRRGAKTVYGGFMASTYPHLCQPFFDSVVIGDAEGCIRDIVADFERGELRPRYVSTPYDAAAVPVPRFDLRAGKNRIPLTLEATRGCTFRCDFCALTGLGTRFHTRPPEMVVRDITEGQRMLKDLVPWYQRKIVTFLDNNIGGNPRYLKELCQALEPLGIVWGSQITFNAIADPEVSKALSRAGCRAMFVGLESFNPATLKDMHKHQNAIERTKAMLAQSRKNGILVGSGLLLSPSIDDLDYISSIPDKLTECGFHMPSYVCFESPIPGTPNFHRLAAEDPPALLPNALLRDFAGFTLVVRPKREPIDAFVNGYRWVLENVFTTRRKLTKLSEDLPRLLANRWWFTSVCDVANNVFTDDHPRPERTYLAGTDCPPPEANTVPFTDADFDSEAQRRMIVDPMRVTDETGRVLPEWLNSTPLYEIKGQITQRALALVGA